MSTLNHVQGSAALSICESLLLSLTDLKVINEAEVVAILQDAISARLKAGSEGEGIEINQAVATLIAGIIDGQNSVRHRK